MILDYKVNPPSQRDYRPLNYQEQIAWSKINLDLNLDEQFSFFKGLKRISNVLRCYAIPALAKRDPPGVMKITRRVRWEDGIAMLSKHALFTAKQVFLLSVDLKFLLLNSGRDHPPRPGSGCWINRAPLAKSQFSALVQ